MTSATTPATFRAVARVTVAWAVLFALVHFYWAAGGAVGMNGNPADTPAAQAYIAFIAVLGIAGAAVAHGRWLAQGGLGGDGAAGIAIAAYFLLGGVLFTALGKAQR